MTENQHRIGVFPGTFDPITNGHLDVIRRAGRLFDELIVAVGNNPEKPAILSQSERADIIAEVTAETGNVRVEAFEGLTVDFARRIGASAILRGIRNSTDLHFELQAALTNRVVAGVETVFIMTATEYAFTSSTLIRQVASMGGDVSALVPPAVLPHLEKLSKNKDDGMLDEAP